MVGNSGSETLVLIESPECRKRTLRTVEKIFFGAGLFFISSCIFRPYTVKRDKENLVFLSQFAISSKIKTLEVEHALALNKNIYRLMKKCNVEVFGLGNEGWNYHFEPKDSVVVFVNHGSYLFGRHKRVFYDFAKNPRHFIDTTIEHNNYSFIKVSERFYLSSQKTDR